MTDAEKEAIQHADKATLLLGYSTAIILDMKPKMSSRQKRCLQWFLDAVQAVVYEDGNIPPLPDDLALHGKTHG